MALQGAKIEKMLLEEHTLGSPLPPLTAYAFDARVIGERSLFFLNPRLNKTANNAR